MNADTCKCLVGSLYAGENESQASYQALVDQSFQRWESFQIRDLPEKDAHERLYRTFMDNRGDFDLFVKLDCDMIFSSTRTLDDIVRFVGKRPGLDHACFAVHDYMSGRPVMGLHVFSSRAVWEPARNSLHPDQKPWIPGKRLMVWGPPAPVASHAPDPTPYQAFHFGVHRMGKALNARSRKLACHHWDVIHRVARKANATGDRRLWLAVIGAWHVWCGDMGAGSNDIEDERKRHLFLRYADADSAELRDSVRKRWLARLACQRRAERTAFELRQCIRRFTSARSAKKMIDSEAVVENE